MSIKNTIFISLISLFFLHHGFAADTQGVVVTIKPLHSLVSGVLGDTGEAQLLLTNNASPHDFHLKPSQVRVMQQAQIIFYIDDNLETFLHKTLKTLPDHIRKIAVAKNAGLELLPYREGDAWSVEKHGGHDRHDHDLHVWLDPHNARGIVKYIAKELSQIYPQNRAIYQENSSIIINKINNLETELKKSLEVFEDKPFIVFHDAYQYFERAYNLKAVGAVSLPDQSSLPNHLRRIRAKIENTGALCAFREPQFSDRLVKTVIEGTDIKSGIIDPLGSELHAGTSMYFNLMRQITDNLKQCLE